jgi:hypothetical protein
MLSLRYAALAAIALWAGGLVVLGAVAAPSIFDTIAARNVADGRALAGAIFGETLRRFQAVSYACAAVLIASLLLRRALGPPPSRSGIRLAIASVMAAAALYSGVVLSGKIEHVRIEAGGAPSSLAENDPRRVEFSRLHGLSVMLSMVPIFGGLILVFWEMRD